MIAVPLRVAEAICDRSAVCISGVLPVSLGSFCARACWGDAQKNTGYDVSSFARDWLAAVRRKTPAIKKVYSVFKDYVKAEAFDTKVLLEELLKYSKHYKAINAADSGNHRLDAVLRRLILLDMSVMNPFTLNLLEYRRCGEISDQQVIEALESVETYLFRRWVCKVPTNALNKVFETLHSEVLRGVKDGGSYPDVLNKVLLSFSCCIWEPNIECFQMQCRLWRAGMPS